MSDFVDFVGAELPLRIVLIKGTDATGEPVDSGLAKVQLAPTGTQYLQDDVSPKILWYKQGTSSADWAKVGSGGGGGGLAATNLDIWDLDEGTQPLPVDVGNFVADKFDGALDTTLYIDEVLGVSYDPAKIISFRYTYSLSGTSTDQVSIKLGHSLQGGVFSPRSGYTEITDTFAGDGDTDIRSRVINIPAYTGVLDLRPILSLQLTRLGDTDTNAEDFNLFSTIIYQE